MNEAEDFYYGDEFRQSMIRLRQKFSLAEIIEIERLVADLWAAGVDPIRELRAILDEKSFPETKILAPAVC